MENIKGMSIVDTKEYLALLELKEAMKKDFVTFEYGCRYKRIFAFSKDDFINKHKAGLDNLKKQYEDDIEFNSNMHKERVEFLNQELDRLENNTQKINWFGWNSFLRGLIAGLGISVFIYSLSLILK
jgi:hypothetical protein